MKRFTKKLSRYMFVKSSHNLISFCMYKNELLKILHNLILFKKFYILYKVFVQYLLRYKDMNSEKSVNLNFF